MEKIEANSDHILDWLEVNNVDQDHSTSDKHLKIGFQDGDTLRLNPLLEVDEELLIHNQQYQNNISFRGDFLQGIVIENSEFKDLHLNTKSLKFLEIVNSSFRHIYIHTSDIGEIRLEHIKVDSLIVYYSVDYPFTISIKPDEREEKKNRIEQLKLFGATIGSNGYFAAEDIILGELSIDKINNHGRIIFSDCGPKTNETKFEIINSRLGQIVFNNFRFDQFERIKLIGSNLSTIESFGTHIPVMKKFGFKPSDYEIFGNLAVAMSKIGNRDMEFDYKRAYLKNKLAFLQEKKIAFWTRVVLNWNRLSSDNGQNWILPLVWILGLGLVFFTLYFVALGPKLFTGGYSLQYNPNYLSNFLQGYGEFLLPTHRLTFLSDKPGGWVFWDIIFRVINGYLIYQMITAFRRIGKI